LLVLCDRLVPILAQVVSRTGKLAYEWRGLAHLPALLDRLVADEVHDLATCRYCTPEHDCEGHFLRFLHTS
jgi:hypothetical protein